MNTKLQKFIEAAISNQKHPVYKLGYSKHPILQSYALCVSVFETHTPARWADEYPESVATMESVMKLCEEEETVAKAEDERVKKLESDVETLKSQMAEYVKAAQQAPANPGPAQSEPSEIVAPAPEPSTDA